MKTFYQAYVLTGAARAALLSHFPTKFPHKVAHHITAVFGVPENTPPLPPAKVRVIGYAADEHLECVVVKVNGHSTRVDGGFFHITLSHDDSVSAKYANDLLARQGFTLVKQFDLETVPTLLDR